MPKDLSKFATTDRPLHPSGLQVLVSCPWRSVMRFLSDAGDEEGGEAADTGSAVHRAVEAFHKERRAVADCIEVMRADVHIYPKADLMDAAQLFLMYATDPRNIDAEVVLCEEPISFRISPAPEDPTGAPIEVEGTVDQVRRHVDNRFKVWDIKTSKKDPTMVRINSTMQGAAYCIGASIKLGETVHPGGIIMPRLYKGQPEAPVFRDFLFRFEDIEQILRSVRHVVARIRSGDVWHVPTSANCEWCHAKTPDICLPRMKRELS